MKTRALVLSVIVLLCLGAGYALAQDGTLARIQPLLVDIQQQIPVDVTLVIDSAEPQTVTVPMSLDLNLQISLSSTMTPVVKVAPSAPIITISAPNPDEPTVDALGITYIVAPQPAIEIIEWTAYTGETGNLYIAGELRVTDEAPDFDRPEFVLRLYDSKDKLLDVISDPVLMYDPQPGDSSRFKITTFVDAAKIDHYTVEIVLR